MPCLRCALVCGANAAVAGKYMHFVDEDDFEEVLGGNMGRGGARMMKDQRVMAKKS